MSSSTDVKDRTADLDANYELINNFANYFKTCPITIKVENE